MIVVSTRIPLGQVPGALVGFRRLDGVPIVAIVHAGGEDVATELLRAGAAGLVAEGNEAAVAAFVGEGRSDASLVETYDQRLGRTQPTDFGSPGLDPITGLLTESNFDARLAEAAQAGEVPRVAYISVVNFEESARRLSTEASNLLQRRLSGQFREIARLYDAELYSCSPTRFAFVAQHLSSEGGRELGQLLIRAAETFAPSGGRPLSLAIGHAGPEVTTEISAVRELAQRAMELASTGSDSVVLSADDLSKTLAATTELDVLLRMVEAVELRWSDGVGRGHRVGELAARLARQLGFEGLDRSQIRLAAHLHEIGKLSLDPELVVAPGQLTAEQLAAYQRYPAIGAEYLRISAGPDVSLAVRHHQERWDGTGFPEGLAAEDIAVGGRIIAVAVQLDSFRSGERDKGVSKKGIERLAAEAGSRFDPTVVSAARGIMARDALDSPMDATGTGADDDRA